MAKVLRGGFTTGAAAAAGARAALLFLKRGEVSQEIHLEALDGTMLTIPIQRVEKTEQGAKAEVIKEAGDDPDITNGVSVWTEVRPQASADIIFRAGEGIGTVTKAGLSVPVGEPSINFGPRKLIRRALADVLAKDEGCEVIISIPAGKELAKRTLNPILGIEGGISVIGTTGVLRPMSEEAFKNSLVPQMDVALAAGYQTQIFVPGKMGENAAVHLGLPREAIVQTSNFIGFMLQQAADKGLKGIMLFGHVGKMVKLAGGSFYTHNRMADGRMETIAAYAAAEGMSRPSVKAILAATTTEEAFPIVRRENLWRLWNILAARASLRAERYVFQRLRIGVVMTTLRGEVLGMETNAKRMGRDFHWNIES